jgi:predicted MFS family arabinose efflux permease
MASTPPPTDPVIRAAVAALALAAFASGISQRSMDALLPRLAEDFGLSIGAVAGVITAFTIGYAAAQPFFGPLGDRHGKYRVIAWSAAACTVSAIACALAPDLPWLLAARAFAGAMGAATIPLAMAWIGDVIPYEQRQPVLAQFLIGQILGVAAGQLIGGLSADYLGRRAPFVIAAVLFAASTALLLQMRPRLPAAALEQRGPGPAGAPAGGLAGGVAHVVREYREILRLPWARVVLLSSGVEGAMVFGAFAFFAAHLHATLGVSLTAAGLLVMPFGLGGLVFALGTRRLLGRLGELGLARAGGGLMLAAALTVAAAPGLVTAVIACFAMGLGFYMLHNTLQTNATQMAPERRGAAVSAFAFSYFLGQSVGVSAAGWAVSRAGTAPVIAAAAFGIVAVALRFAHRKQRSLSGRATAAP